MTRLWMLALCALSACSGGRGSAPAPARAPAAKHRAQPGDVAIVGATVVPMDREGTLAGHTVLVRGDRIVVVAPAADVDTSAATVVDGKGTWLLPGLADMHVHIQDERDLDLFLLAGVTTVRDLFGSPRHLQWRDAIARGERPGPTLLAAGPIIDGDPPTWPTSAVVTTPEAARKEVQAQKKAGYDWLKVYNGLPADAYDALVAEAKAVGMPVAGHVPRAVGLDKAIASGQRSIEHVDGYVPFRGDLRVDAEVVAATAKAGVWNCPTLVVTERFGRMDDPAALAGTRGLDLVAPEVRDAWDPKKDFRLKTFTPEMYAGLRERNAARARLVADLHRAGAKLVLGTDTGNPYVVPGFAVADELGLLVAAGLTPWQALRTATAAAADFAGTPGAFGVVAAGARADLILVSADPLANVSAVADPLVVIARGKVHRHEDLLAVVKAPPKRPADRFAGLPPLAAEGKEPVTASYELLFNGTVMGAERAVASRVGGALVVQGHAVYDRPRTVMSYRATPDGVDMTVDGAPVKAARQGGKVAATHGGGEPVELAAGDDAIVAPQVMGPYFWFVDRLAGLQVGASKTITTVEVRTERGVALEPGTYTYTRRDDREGRRVYDVVGTVGKLALTGTLTVDADGAPHEATATVKWGTFTTRRLP